MRVLAGAVISDGVGSSARDSRGPVWAEVVPEAARGSAEATRTLLRAVAPRVLGAVRRVLGFGPLAADAEDVTQETLLALVKALPTLREPNRVVAFASRSAVRNALRHRRRAENLVKTVTIDHAEALTDSGRDPDARLVARQRSSLLLSLLDELPDAQSEALALRVCLGHTLEEVADIMQCPVNTVRSRVRLGREALASKLEKRAAARDLLEVDGG